MHVRLAGRACLSPLQSVCTVSWKHLLAACRGFPAQQNKERLLTPCKQAQQVFPGAEVETLDSPKLAMSLLVCSPYADLCGIACVGTVWGPASPSR